MSIILGRSSFESNPPVGTHHLTVAGSDWLWAVCAIHAFGMLLVIGHAYFARQGERIFHYLFTIALLAGAVAYYTMGSDLGNAPVVVADNLSHPGTRQIFYVKYINWFFAWTAINFALGLISGVSWATIIYNITLSWIWVISWVSGAFTPTNYKWGFYAFGVFSYFLLAASLLTYGRTSATRVGIKLHYTILAGWTLFMWLLYPIAWGLDDGGNKIKVTSGFVFFGILDVLLIPVLAGAFLVLCNRWDYGEMNLRFTQYGRVALGANFVEKPTEKAPIPPAPAAEDIHEQTV